ncbi:MAG: DUF2334 domain-containing protein [Actinomycetota bacterium]
MGRRTVNTRRITGAIAVIAIVAALTAPSAAFARTAKKPGPTPPPSTGGVKALILYDTSNSWGYLGELYATMTANLVGHFGTYSSEPVSKYTAGQMSGYTAAIYIGSTWDEPIPNSFLDDVAKGTTPVMWVSRNIWELTSRDSNFQSQYGWMWSGMDQSDVQSVQYKGTSLLRDTNNEKGIMGYGSIDSSRVTTLAQAVRPDGTKFPWAVRSGNLTYIGEMPLSYIGTNDRYLIFTDLLFDLLAPTTPVQHRAMIRLEDVGPDSDPADLRADADYLYSQGVPFSFGVYPLYRDPNGVSNDGQDTTIHLKDARDVASAINYMISKGGTMIMHGYTHQYSNVANPYNGQSADDFEFFTAHVDDQNYVRLDGPVAEDSYNWALGRMQASAKEFQMAHLNTPTIFEFPHYAGSAVDYQAAASMFTTRYERSLYYNGVLSAGTPATDTTHMVGQFFPYVVNDVYGSKVLPEDLGNFEPEWTNNNPPRSPQDMIDTARRDLAVRDGFASFFFHPYYDINALKQTVQGIKALGYTFVSPSSL